MPSPFPGMDPYIEGDLWGPFHSLFASQIVWQLVPKISPRYLALPEKRYIVIESDEENESSRVPDVEVRRSEVKGERVPQEEVLAAPLVMATVMSDPEPYFWVEIREAKKKKLVTAIEILSPANKKGKARQEYLEKRTQYLHSSAHLIEIDLIRQGKRLPMRKSLPPVPFFVFLSRAGRRPLTEVWPIDWDAVLPPIPVPLLKGDADVTLDLQEAFNKVYDATKLDLNINYKSPPNVPLPEDKRAWAEALLRRVKKGK